MGRLRDLLGALPRGVGWIFARARNRRDAPAPRRSRLRVVEVVRPRNVQRMRSVQANWGSLAPSGGGDHRRNPQRRGLALLDENLTAAQREQYARHRFFDVIGGDSGKRYRIHYGRQMNVDELDDYGRTRWRWCFVPQGDLVAGDVMLAQKTALELFEYDALDVANRFPMTVPDPLRLYDAERAVEYYRRHDRILRD
jgi:hypothetical protein